jgi:hypothetical protein
MLENIDFFFQNGEAPASTSINAYDVLLQQNQLKSYKRILTKKARQHPLLQLKGRVELRHR